MKPCRQIGRRSRIPAATTLFLALLLLAVCGQARAQEAETPQFTLHVYNNLVQFPTIVLAAT